MFHLGIGDVAFPDGLICGGDQFYHHDLSEGTGKVLSINLRLSTRAVQQTLQPLIVLLQWSLLSLSSGLEKTILTHSWKHETNNRLKTTLLKSEVVLPLQTRPLCSITSHYFLLCSCQTKIRLPLEHKHMLFWGKWEDSLLKQQLLHTRCANLFMLSSIT